jgi:heptose I phosphotransferase
MPLEVAEKFKESWGGEPSFDELMALDGEMYRQVARRKTFKFSRGNQEYFAKIHKGVGWGEVLKNLVSGRLPVLGARNEYDAINALTKLGIKTMTLAAFGQRGLNLAEQDSFVITESLEPSVSLEDLCMSWPDNKPSLKVKRTLIEQVASITRTLHENGINHRDLYICHFLLKENEIKKVGVSDVPLYLIDLHRVQMRATIPRRWRVKDLAALYFSSMEIGLSRRDFYKFIKVYSSLSLRKVFEQEKKLWKDVERKALQLKKKHG